MKVILSSSLFLGRVCVHEALEKPSCNEVCLDSDNTRKFSSPVFLSELDKLLIGTATLMLSNRANANGVQVHVLLLLGNQVCKASPPNWLFDPATGLHAAIPENIMKKLVAEKICVGWNWIVNSTTSESRLIPSLYTDYVTVALFDLYVGEFSIFFN